MKGRTLKRGSSWYYQVDLPPYPDGRRRQKLKGGFRTKREAEAALAQLLVDVAKGLPGSTSKQRVSAFLCDWLAGAAPSVSLSTAAVHERAIRLWISPFIGGMRITDVTPATLQVLYNQLHEKGYSAQTIRLCHSTLRQAFDQALDWGLIGRNPAKARITILKGTEKEKQAWTAEEAGKFLAATADTRLAPMWALFLSTGLRRGEAMGLRWENIDLAKRELHIREARVPVPGGGFAVSSPKTKGSRRTIPLTDGAIDALRRQQSLQAEERIAAGSAWEDTGYVFTDPIGRPLRPGLVNDTLERLVKRLELPPIRVHDLRHTFASIALEKGVHPKLVQEMLGHSNITTTLDTYTHSNVDLHRKAADVIGDALFKPITEMLLPV